MFQRLPFANEIQLWEITMLFMGEPTILMAIFHSYVSHQRVNPIKSHIFTIIHHSQPQISYCSPYISHQRLCCYVSHYQRLNPIQNSIQPSLNHHIPCLTINHHIYWENSREKIYTWAIVYSYVSHNQLNPMDRQEREEHMASEILRRHVSGAQGLVLCCPARTGLHRGGGG